ncbi:hypothetical protein CXF92_06790 [Pseudomonas sp. Choline-3u-10]|uniref:DUF6387 family protein n=1 Tax=Pseudomonadaceae TaxID=135621 RepID=UPI000617FEBC|nr:MULTISPECIES: DUF6387 family protein [unclassified Pseudomonas]MAL35835.1 hypothetical protein [Pseudomonas sp.]MBK3794008.1 hypothetical protein [Stutzerimonas stutzeri]MBU0949147.1 hypothetical protein [Gammaproteobacteria bacterium]MBK3875498.1 hypothetical protein [Stutzerimonas stutzeri]PKG94587.1 hypothetical protein CXF92_06790 [Pseudomonas sp. Choline-3u-10]
MAKIDRVEDLPEWFNLDRYRECENLSATDWLAELEMRRTLFRAYQSLGAMPMWESDLVVAVHSGVADSIREMPIDPSRNEYADLHIQPVRNVNVADLLMQRIRDEIANKDGRGSDEMASRWAAIGDSQYPLNSAMSVAGLPVEIDFYSPYALPAAVIQVDLNSPDSLLRDAFTAWLKEARSFRQSDSGKRQKPLYGRWARYGLLPYLDLMIWGMETHTHIPDRVMSAAISHYDAGEANLRKTIAPLAADLMRDLSGLRAVAFSKKPAETETSGL